MLEALDDFEAGKHPTGSARSVLPVALPNPIDTVLAPQRSWHDAVGMEPA